MYLCRRMKLCGFLLKKGFTYEKIVPDRNNPKFNCWLFKNSPELRNAIEEYYAAEPNNSALKYDTQITAGAERLTQ